VQKEKTYMFFNSFGKIPKTSQYHPITVMPLRNAYALEERIMSLEGWVQFKS
jgi:hypothetical protein